MPPRKTPETPDEFAQQQDRDDLADAMRGTRKLSRKAPLIDRIRDVVETKSAARIDGLLLDLFTASAVIQVHDALNPDNQGKFAALPLRRMVDVTWKLVTGSKKT